ncbi:MAG: hypothetical protein AAF636_23200 [Pseudomonadota bacterium]
MTAILARTLKRWVAVLVVLVASAQPAVSGEPLHRIFAACAGRLSAEVEHQWLVQDQRVEMTERHRARMITLTDATTPEGQEPWTLHLRIQAKHAHKALLSRAEFNDDKKVSRWAASQAESELSRCVGLLLS